MSSPFIVPGAPAQLQAIIDAHRARFHGMTMTAGAPEGGDGQQVVLALQQQMGAHRAAVGQGVVVVVGQGAHLVGEELVLVLHPRRDRVACDGFGLGLAV